MMEEMALYILLVLLSEYGKGVGIFCFHFFLFLEKNKIKEEVIIVVVVVDIDYTKEFKYNIITKITKIASGYAYNESICILMMVYYF